MGKYGTYSRVDTPVLIVRLQKGLADRKRLPLAHVISVLEEVRQMISEAGREIQREHGVERPTGDFGLELVAGAGGFLFTRSSVQAQIAITSDVQNGLLAAQKVLQTVEVLEKAERSRPKEEVDARIVRRLNRIARIQRTDKTEMRIELRKPGRKASAATFGEAAIACARSLQAPTFSVEGLTVFGKLYELTDKNPDDETDKGFWGELRRDNGEVWRVQFKPSDLERVVRLFRRQVSVTGRALYYRIEKPKIVAEDITQDRERDYEAAFDELYGCDKDTFRADFETLLREMRGDG